MYYKKLLGNYKKLSVNVKKYYDFIDYRIPFIKGIDALNFTPEYYEYLRFVITENNFYINTDKLVEHLLNKYNFKELDEKTKLSYIKSLRLSAKGEFLKEHPELIIQFDEWFNKNEKYIQDEINKLREEYSKLNRDRRAVNYKIKNTYGFIKEKYESILETIDDRQSVSLRDRAHQMMYNGFINHVSNELDLLLTYDKNRNIEVPYVRNYVVNEELLHYYLTKMLCDKAQKEDIDEKKVHKIKKYVSSYISDNNDIISMDNEIEIPFKNSFMCGLSRKFSVQPFKDFLKTKTLKKS